MPQQNSVSVMNNFTAGLKTEYTGLNFPENAATDTDNCFYSLVGDVSRRGGINYEQNYVNNSITRSNAAIVSYKWRNAGGDGKTQFVVTQVGNRLYFWNSSNATTAAPLSANILGPSINMNDFAVDTNQDISSSECEFADGNGYLFVFNPSCEPFYVTWTGTTVRAAVISVQIRDQIGLIESRPIDYRPGNPLSGEHLYNLTNQGWTAGNSWTALSPTQVLVGTGNKAFDVPAGLPAANGNVVLIYPNAPVDIRDPATTAMSGTVISYSGTTLVVNVTAATGYYTGQTVSNWVIVPQNTSYINAWFTAVGNWPSNTDVWWNYKNASGAFDPATTFNNVTVNSGPAPKGKYRLGAFSMDRGLASGITGITPVTTKKRPRTGAWFAGRLFMTGVDDFFPSQGNAINYTWTENIYFSQTVTDPTQLGNCFKINDPTSETLFGDLPTDGGIITIQGCGNIYKLFPIQNGLLVFASNGIWFITGSQGIGFTATDYTITEISRVQSIASSSFVNVLGLPYFWNEEGIYCVTPSQKGMGLTVENLTVSTIETFYDEIPISCKKFVRGDFNPINFVIQWTYRDSEATDTNSRYNFNRILNYNTYSKAFYPYSVSGNSYINSVTYVTYPGGSAAPIPSFKYLTSSQIAGTTFGFKFSDEQDTFQDWGSATPVDYESYFVAGYDLKGKGVQKAQSPYVYVYSKNDGPHAYKFQGIWDYAIDRNSGGYTNTQVIDNNVYKFSKVVRRIRLRGRGLVVQIKISSIPNKPFTIAGWASWEAINTGV